MRDYVTLYNISCGGCMIETTSPQAGIGARVIVHLNDMTEIPGLIVWKYKKNAGIKFEATILQSSLEAMGYAISSEDFDANDPRDRYGIPLVGRSCRGGAALQQSAYPDWQGFDPAAGQWRA